MKVIETRLLELAENSEGSVISIGISFPKFFSKLSLNKYVKEFNFLSSIQIESDEGSDQEVNLKTVPLDKLRKFFKKNKIDYIFIDYKHIENYLHSFIQDSIYINKRNIYIVFEDEKELVKVKELYEMYGSNCKYKKEGTLYLLSINNYSVKSNVFTDYKYKLNYNFEKTLDVIDKLF